jgi:hypothetical protein
MSVVHTSILLYTFIYVLGKLDLDPRIKLYAKLYAVTLTLNSIKQTTMNIDVQGGYNRARTKRQVCS